MVKLSPIEVDLLEEVRKRIDTSESHKNEFICFILDDLALDYGNGRVVGADDTDVYHNAISGATEYWLATRRLRMLMSMALRPDRPTPALYSSRTLCSWAMCQLHYAGNVTFKIDDVRRSKVDKSHGWLGRLMRLAWLDRILDEHKAGRDPFPDIDWRRFEALAETL